MSRPAVLALAASLAACGGGASLGDCPPASEMTQMAGKAVMERSCVTCHSTQVVGAARAGAPGDVNFDTRAGVQDRIEDAWTEAESGSMPPGAKLMASDLETLRVYLACGATAS